jgi:PleD family two-component response regulator
LADQNPFTLNLRMLQRRLPVIKDQDSNWYQGWYFDLRLEEELARCTRYDVPLSVLVFVIREPVASEANSRLLRELLHDIVERKLRRTDLPAVLASNEYAVSLPHTPASHGSIVARRLVKAFAPFTVGMGLVSYPEDGKEPERLLDLAEQRALASFQVTEGEESESLRRSA